ncbi:GYF domain-containing protein [Pseudoxanthomonas winnipegensis]|uniref:DUF4339 domain-containing protein n=1 Tax=Pseudoxanthomonas winnipegensis TaxID=2480810 RepID=A0A4Q8M265_9GAMM|nr:GYF domain-containing protein [Pseudoxanthomonas winnipegensis]TAA40197.1 DUF4339 domain-containing protein [Pseudoxanthomonas winnipegensis]
MSQWYYRHEARTEGPVPTEDILRLLRDGTLGQQSLLWREGLAQWHPLSTLRPELGLGPALPPAPPPLAASATAQHAPARRGLSGCAIAAIVALACAVPVTAILAAITIPAYQDYVTRSVIAQALSEAAPVQAQVQQAIAQAPSGSCPANGQPPFRAPGDYAGRAVSAITIGKFPASGACGLKIVLRRPGQARLDGKRIWLEADGAGGWRCRSELPGRQLPAQCRAGGR